MPFWGFFLFCGWDFGGGGGGGFGAAQGSFFWYSGTLIVVSQAYKLIFSREIIILSSL